VPDLTPGDLCWAELDPVRGREQSGRRPVLVVASADYLRAVTSLAIVVPVTSVDRGWPNHVPIVDPGLSRPSWAMTEQPRTLNRDRLVGVLGRVVRATLDRVRTWLADFLTD
jgi:mRNA interferase MazF